MTALPRLFASTYPYALIKHARAVGLLKGGPEEEQKLSMTEQDLGPKSTWPAFRTIGKGGPLDEIEPSYRMAEGSGSIGQARSRVSGRFLRHFPGCDVHLSIDDDIECGKDTLANLIGMCRKIEGFVTVPYLLRDGKTASIAGVSSDGKGSFHARQSGMGLVAMHRKAVEALADRTPFAVDDKGLRYPAFFLEYIDEREHGWLGEDIAFSARMRAAGIPWHVLPEAPITHAGRGSVMRSDGSFSVDAVTAERL